MYLTVQLYINPVRMGSLYIGNCLDRTIVDLRISLTIRLWPTCWCRS